jgi:cytochrome d ubiquinol oxidase subunit I
MRTSQAVTEAKGIWFVFGAAILLYAALGTACILVLRTLSRRWREGGDPGTPYDPGSAT